MFEASVRSSAATLHGSPSRKSGADRMAKWFPDYQTRDIDLVDYQEFQIAGCEARFRGPGFDPLAAREGSFFTCLGAAQTYGCFYDRPFPTLLSEKIGLRALNLAIGGVGPGFYVENPCLVEAMNRGAFVILQAMSARHCSNGRLEANGYVEFVFDRATGDSLDSTTAWTRLLERDVDLIPQLVSETRQSWIEGNRELIGMLTVPVIFFWFGQRDEDEVSDLAELRRREEAAGPDADPSALVRFLLGEFPQLVDGASAKAVRDLCDAAARCVSTRGMGAPLLNRHSGQPIDPREYEHLGLEFFPLRNGRNDYYPSVEMHEDAARALLPAIKSLNISS